MKTLKAVAIAFTALCALSCFSCLSSGAKAKKAAGGLPGASPAQSASPSPSASPPAGGDASLVAGTAAKPEVIVPEPRPVPAQLKGIRLPLPALPARTPTPTQRPLPSAVPRTPSPLPARSPSPSLKASPKPSPTRAPSPAPSMSPKASAKASPAASQKPAATPLRSLPPVPFSQIRPLSSEEMQKKAAYSLIVPRGKRFDIPMQGTAWTYIGSSGEAEGILYQGRKREASKVVFAFDPVVPGEYLLEFTRQDTLLDEIETVFVRVIVEPEEGPVSTPEAAASSNRPDTAWGASPTSPPSTSDFPSAAAASSLPSSASSAPSSSIAAARDFSAYDGPALLSQAGKDIDSGKAEDAFAALESYKARYGMGDEYLYWSAKAVELPGPRRDILKARALYVQLLEEYPESPRYDAADARIEYIDRRYLEIR